jgi:hypothetical protein
MFGRRVLLYFAWSRPEEIAAPLFIIDDRFPAIFELRRLFFPKLEQLSDPLTTDQGIAGFLDHVQKPNFQAFAAQSEALTGHKVVQVERVTDDGRMTPLDVATKGVDTVIVISFDSFRTEQAATVTEVEAIRDFLEDPDHLVFICPHHDIGESAVTAEENLIERQYAEYQHHGDRAIPPRQGFGGFARTLLAGLGVPVENRFGLRPAVGAGGSPAPVEIERALDEFELLRGVDALNLHPHLPQLERVGAAVERMDVLVRQNVDMSAPPHPFTQAGRTSFDAILQSRPETFAGKVLVCDTTLFSSMAGGIENLRRLWANVVQRPQLSSALQARSAS